ncbi:hybrid sensor histidine kinase/response regulator transcription factor [Ancylomarina sp. 16SWW S1-10-2]|uniref:hybrid sensor histidine kinase/response regulator transcription factor n=1 Tax=Ancylomarina sp. 16SWW S1-10-2 TaxID=2499681 RepID=UPI00189FE099|nr:hybrid sensor histidine kinase/response regulator transcription factor [Ancylomarina sp. 16SWW S1-10-2]
MKKIKLLILLGLLFCQLLSVTAQKYFPFKHYNYENGLLSNTVNSITQDKDDFIWIGTSEGLCRFNGCSFDNFQNIPGDSTSIADNFISSIAEDISRNCLWLVTSTGISKFDKNNYQFQNYIISTSVSTSYTPFARGSVCVDSKGNVWVEGFNEGFSEGLFRYNPEEDMFINISKNNKNVPQNLTAIYEDKNERLWLGSEKGLYYYIPQTNSFKQVEYITNNKDQLYVTTLFADSENKLWIGSKQSNSLYVCVNDSISKFFEPNLETTEYNWISSISSYNKDIILAGIRDFGVLVLNQVTGKSHFLQPDLYNPKGIKSKTPRTMFTDKFGNLWIGSYNNGLNFIDRHRKLFDHYHFDYTSNGLMSNSVRALFEDTDGEIWIGTKEGGGISRFNAKKGIFDNYKADKTKNKWIDNDIIIAINELEPGKLLIGTFGSGIFTYHKNENYFSQFATASDNKNSISNNNVYSLYKDFNGKIWIGNNSFVDIYNPTTKQFSHLKNVTYARCFLDIGDYVLIGTWSNGVYLYNKANGKAQIYDLKDSNNTLNNKIRINGITQDVNKNIWLATNKGLVEHNFKTKTNKIYDEKDGLSNDYICAVLPDDYNNIWVSTKGGISKLNTTDNTFKNYDKNDGLQSNVFEEFVSLKTSGGKLLFSGPNGFNIFHPDSIKDNPNIPNVVISEMYVLNEPVKIGEPNSPLTKHISLTKELELTYEQSSFSFEFIGINYTSSENNQYRYKLEGYDTDWKNAKHNRIATYTHVPAGNYIFKVIASNNDGLWNNEGSSIAIKIWPPFWKSKIAMVIYFIILLLSLSLFAVIITYRANHEHKLKVEILEKQRIEEAGKMRLKFFTNISHELRTPLTLITAPLESLINYETKDQQLKALIMGMNRNAQRLLRLINQLMDYRSVEKNRIKLRVSKGTILADSQEILNSFSYVAQNKNITLHFTTKNDQEIESWYDFGILEKILFNLLSNAIKFTNKGGTIELNIQIENGQATIKIKDDGIGIAPNLLDKVFDRFYTTDFVDYHQTGTGIGLSFTKSLIDLHRGSINVESVINEGSCFTVIIPVAKTAFSKDELSTITKKQVVISNTKPKISITVSTEKQVDKKKDYLMIVEDNDDLRKYLISSFQNYNIIECSNGEEALEQAKDKMPDIILSDIMMPKMNGLELCNHLKTDYITSHIPIILLTARTSDDQKMEGFKHHADAYIEKPFNIELLKIQVDNLIELRKNIKVKYKGKDILKTIEDDIVPIDKLFLDKVSEIIQAEITDCNLSVESLSSALGMSRSQLFRKFKALMDTTPSQFIRVTRLNYASELLQQHQHNVNEVTFMAGFSDVSHFISLFKNQFGQTPKQYSESSMKNTEG